MLIEILCLMLFMHPVKKEVKPMIGEAAYQIGDFTNEDIELMQRCVMSEAGGQPYECQEAVATVILNRYYNPDKYPDSIQEIIVPGQFSTADNGKPTVSVKVAVLNAIRFWGTETMCIPKCIYYFRAYYYHEWALDYRKIGDLYFSAPRNAVFD